VTTSEKLIVVVTLKASVTVIVSGYVPCVVGVPEIVPVAVSYVTPLGSVPVVMA
jgi:hypothetical protein